MKRVYDITVELSNAELVQLKFLASESTLLKSNSEIHQRIKSKQKTLGMKLNRVVYIGGFDIDHRFSKLLSVYHLSY